MDGQQSGGASLRGRGRPTRLPDTVTVKAPGGTRDAIEKAAVADGMAAPDWLRRLIRRGIEASRKRRERRGGGGGSLCTWITPQNHASLWK